MKTKNENFEQSQSAENAKEGVLWDSLTLVLLQIIKNMKATLLRNKET